VSGCLGVKHRVEPPGCVWGVPPEVFPLWFVVLCLCSRGGVQGGSSSSPCGATARAFRAGSAEFRGVTGHSEGTRPLQAFPIPVVHHTGGPSAQQSISSYRVHVMGQSLLRAHGRPMPLCRRSNGHHWPLCSRLLSEFLPMSGLCAPGLRVAAAGQSPKPQNPMSLKFKLLR